MPNQGNQGQQQQSLSNIDLQGLVSTLRQGSQDNSTSEEYRQAMRQCVTIFDVGREQIQQWISQGNSSGSMAAGAGGTQQGSTQQGSSQGTNQSNYPRQGAS